MPDNVFFSLFPYGFSKNEDQIASDNHLLKSLLARVIFRSVCSKLYPLIIFSIDDSTTQMGNLGQRNRPRGTNVNIKFRHVALLYFPTREESDFSLCEPNSFKRVCTSRYK